MLTNDEIDRLLEENEYPRYDGLAITRFAHAVEREAYKRAAAECRALAQKYQTFGRTMPSQASRLLYVSMNAGVLNAADTIEALGREE